MRKLIYLMILISLQLGTPVMLFGQSYHFIYLQSENRQPFYVKLNKQVISSALSGYCILPKLQNGTYSLTIGFNNAGIPEQLFNCTVLDKDAGYLIRNLGDKGWVLFNLQTMETLAASGGKSEPVAATQKVDEFSDMLSTVVNDPSIRQPVKEPARVKAAPVPDPPAATEPAQKDQVQPVVSKAPPEEPGRRPANAARVRQLEAETVDQVLRLTYLDQGTGETDTIVVLLSLDEQLPVTEKPAAVQPEIRAEPAKPDETDSSQSATPPPAEKDTVVTVFHPADTIAEVRPVSQAQPRFLPVEVKPAAGEDATAMVSAPAPMINSDCRETATDDDFLKLRKKMAAADNDDDMLSAARKLFKTRCFSTAQIRNLGVLFLKDDGRYRFFDQAYPFVWDSHQFASLENQLSDPYYINRFRAMVRR